MPSLFRRSPFIGKAAARSSLCVTGTTSILLTAQSFSCEKRSGRYDNWNEDRSPGRLLPSEVIATAGSDVLRAQLLKTGLGAGCCVEE